MHVDFPGDRWLPEDDLNSAGLDPARWESFKSGLNIRGASWEGEDHSGNQWGVVVTRRGRVIGRWGNPEYRFQTASVGKAFTWAAFGLAYDAGMVDPDDLVNATWTGEGELSHEHKFLNRGHHAELTWRHLLGSKTTYGHDGGFPVTNGFYWRKRSSAQMSSQSSFKAADWAEWTGDPFFDNYSHVKPGTERIYSSGGIWRLSQALTVLCGHTDSSTLRTAHHERHRVLSAQHEAELGGLVDQHVHGQRDEVEDLNLHDRPHAGDRGPDAAADEGRFRDGGILELIRTELLKQAS